MNQKQSAKRLTVEAVRKELSRIRAILIGEMLRRQSCETSWGKQEDLASEEGVTGIEFTEQDKKDRDQAMAGYDRKIMELEHEVAVWEDALSHALDALERD